MLVIRLISEEKQNVYMTFKVNGQDIILANLQNANYAPLPQPGGDIFFLVASGIPANFHVKNIGKIGSFGQKIGAL